MDRPDHRPAVPMRAIRRFWDDRRGATAVEYTLIAAIMSLMTITAFTNLENALLDLFGRLIALLDSSI